MSGDALKLKKEDGAAPEQDVGRMPLFKKRKIMTEDDIGPHLKGEHVDTYWSEPPFQGWWVARVQSLNMGTMKAKLYYDRGDEGAEVEEMDLLKEVRAGHVSMHEDGLPCRNTIARPKPKRPRAPRPPRPRKDAAAKADAAGAPAEGDNAPEAEACDEEDEEEEEDEDEGSASESDEVLEGPRARKPSARARAAAESDDDLPSAEELLSRKRKAAERAVAAGAARAAAEAKAKAARSAPRERERAAPKPDPRAAAAAAEAEKEREQRQRVASSLAEALATAAAELAAEGAESSPDASPADIAAAVEEAVYRAHGGLSKEYKARIRSLAFNLKDAANPDLRARVLLGEVLPAKLAVMSPDDLASRQLSAWRQAKAAEAVNAVTVRADADVDKLGRRLRKTHKGEEVVEAADDGIAETPSLPPLPPAPADEVAPPEPFSPGAPGAGGGPFSAAGGADLLAAEAGSRGDGAPVESFEAFAARAAEDESARAPSGAKRTRIELPSEDVTVVRAAPQPAPPPPAPVAPRPAPAPAPAPAPRAPRAPKPPAGPEWSGTLQKDSPGLSLPLHAQPVGGEQAPLGGGFLPAVLHVKGRTTLEQVEKYVTDIQRGRSGSRGLTLATAAPPAGASDADRASLAALAASYAERGRAGVAQPSSSVEVYLVPDGDLARRILAAEALPPPAEGAMLLVAVHHKGLGPAKPKRLPSPDALHPAASPDKAAASAAVEAPAAPPAAPDIQNDFLAVTKALLAAAAGNASAMGVLNAALPPQRPRMGDEDLPEFDLFGGRAPAMQLQQPQLMMPPQQLMQAPMGQMPPQMMMMQQQQMPPGYGAPQGYPGAGMYGAGAPIPGPRPPAGPPPGPRPPPGPPPPSAWLGAPPPQQQPQMWQQQPQFQVPLGVDPRGPPPPMGIRPPMPPPGPPPGMMGMQQGMMAPPQPWEVAQQPPPWMQQGPPPPQPPPGQPPQRLDPRMR